MRNAGSRSGAERSPRAWQAGPAVHAAVPADVQQGSVPAYGNIYPNKGAMTPGAGGETADGMSEGKIDEIIELMRSERYRFAPARRVWIPKKNGKLRPLG